MKDLVGALLNTIAWLLFALGIVDIKFVAWFYVGVGAFMVVMLALIGALSHEQEDKDNE